jgi:CRISPR type I-E-associated protein CasA/Cse1
VSYNLLEEKWIPVLWRDGRPGRVGIREALREAGRIRQIAAPNPMDNVALLRFLMAVLLWCKPEMSLEEAERASKDEAIPAEWLSKLDQFKECFEMLGKCTAFYQDKTAWLEVESNKKRKKADSDNAGFRPASDLLQELPSGTNVAHFRHTRDFRDGLCPACCAVGLVRLSSFASASAHGAMQQKPAGINGATPVYGVPALPSLLETLRATLPSPLAQGDSPSWTDPTKPGDSKNIGPMRAFTWLPRRTWIERPHTESDEGVCASCGQRARLVTRIAFLPGWKRPFEKESWPGDPHAVSFQRPAKDEKKRKASIPALPNVQQPANVHAKSWRALYRAVFARFANPAVEIQAPSRAITCSRAAANKALYQDAVSELCFLPLNARNSQWASAAQSELDFLESLDLNRVLSLAIRRNADSRREIGAALANGAAHVERSLRRRFEQFLSKLAGADTDEKKTQYATDWRREVEGILAEQVRRACRLLVGGSVLRQQEVIDRALHELRQKIQEDLKEPKKARAPAGARVDRAKRGES